MENQPQRFLHPRSAVGRVALAVLSVAVALALTLAVQTVAARAYFILFVPAVMFSAWFGGRSTGLIASALTVVATIYLLPTAELADQLAWLIVAAIVTSGTSMLTDARRRAEASLMARAEGEESRRRDAESLGQLRSDVLLQVAHELRQPLSAITAAALLLERPVNEQVRQRAVSVIGRQTTHLGLLLEDLLDLAKMTRRELRLRKSQFDLCDIVDDSLGIIAADAAAHGLQLSSSLPECPLHVTADPMRVRQMLSNLLSNAVKFTPDGGKIDLVVERTLSDVVMRVRDNGRGIPRERLPQVFEMFQKGDGEGTGLGIGLAVVKGLAEMHGGSVEAHSDGPNHGSEFVVTLPQSP